ncbi:uncharacterized protein DDB_G0272530-like isoform X2 [Macrobrachium rosenbergii]|uniref:uncharacterized protein DDB_G0272530-like isoform X2 n=1 Tax=Macrobrachium rosenbergii TaxID=79674 RepID=UPI0034D56823
MMFMQKLFLLLLPTVALAENATAEEPRVAPAEDVTTVESRVALAENETTEENVSEDIAFDTGVFGNETNTTMSYEEVEAKTFCRDTIGQCHNEGGVCMTSHSIKSWGSGGQCSSTKTFSSGNCPVCHCCIGMRCSQTKSCESCRGKCDTKCSTVQRPYDDLCSYGSCTCCLPPCETSSSCLAKGGRCIDDRLSCGGQTSKDCPGHNCKCCVNPPPPIKPPPHPEVCRTTSECKHRGGYCCGREHCTSGHFAKKYCDGGHDCGCCINRPEPEKCRTTSECKHKGGYCCGREHCTSGHFAKKYCHGGHDCGCCINRPVPEKCDTTSECKQKGGYCCGREHCTNGHFVKRYCHGGRDCGCCLKESCQEKQSCTRAKGRCKSSCQSHESEHHGGCSGSGCKCCCPKSHPSPYGREVTTDEEAN